MTEVQKRNLIERVVKATEEEPGFFGDMLRAIARNRASKRYHLYNEVGIDAQCSAQHESLGVLLANSYADNHPQVIREVTAAAFEDMNCHKLCAMVLGRPIPPEPDHITAT